MAADTRGVFTLKAIRNNILNDEGVPLGDVFVGQPDESTATPNTGYFGGGIPARSTMDKLTYSTDTTEASPSANLTVGRQSHSATSSSLAGYFGGGRVPGYTSSMEKLTYSSDTTAATPGAALSAARSNHAATGNSTAGYFGGGDPGPLSTMDKVTYSSDTTAVVPGAALSGARKQSAATGNSTHGYFGGGNFPVLSTMDKTTYSTDTTAAVPGAALVSGFYQASATGNSTVGYFGAGWAPGLSSRTTTLDKLTYSTDTTAAVPSSADLSVGRSLAAATGNSTAGYFGGGFNPAGQPVSTMDKTTYSSDTTALVPGAALSLARSDLAASSARANALPEAVTTTFPITSIEGDTEGPTTGYCGGGRAP